MSAARPLAVIPTFNEAANLRELAHELLAAEPSLELLVVDDASPDGTGALAEALAHESPRVHVLHRDARRGLGTAYVAGFQWGLARPYDSFLEIDADFSHAPRDVPRLLAALREGAELAIGSRYVRGGAVEGWGLGRHLLSRGGSLYARALLHVPVRDLTSGFKAYSRTALQAIDVGSLRSNGYSFQIETTQRALHAGLSVVELPVVFVDRRVGRSKMSLGIFLEAITVVWRLERMP